jgi:glycosyltransferase involved in cell wall biosynthesis
MTAAQRRSKTCDDMKLDRRLDQLDAAVVETVDAAQDDDRDVALAHFSTVMHESKIHVAYVVTRGDDLGGAQVHVRDMAKAMRARGHEATIICGLRGDLTEQLEGQGVPFRSLPHLVRPIQPAKDVLGVLELRRALSDLQPDVVSLHSSKAHLLGGLAARSLGLPVLITVHGWPFADGVPPRSRYFYAIYERFAARLATAVITVSQEDQNLAQRYGITVPGGISVVHNGMPDDARRRDHTRDSGPARLLMVGRHVPQKDHATLFRALAKLRDQAWIIDLIGAGPDENKNKAMARELGLFERVRFLGYRTDVPDLMAKADINVLISNWEGLPRSIIEAMRAELPTVASDVGGNRELVADDRTGYLAPRGDADAVAHRLASLIADRRKRQVFGANARRCFEQGFTFAAMFDKTMAVYRRIVETA